MKADDLIDKLIEKALDEVTSRQAEEPEESRRRAATQIAIGALRYFMLKYTRNSVIAFDFGEALSFAGETGPYVQYAAVRARRILRKLEERGEKLPDFRSGADPRSHGPPTCRRRLLAAAASRLQSRLRRRTRRRQRRTRPRGPLRLPLAQAFSSFYQEFHVLTNPIPRRKPSCCG